MLRPISVVVPAAGRASRMGAPKLLLEMNGEPLLARAVRLASEIDPSPVVVLRPDDAAACAVLAGLACRIVINPRLERGPASSIARGVEAVRTRLPDEAGAGERAVLVLLPDMPFVDTDMLHALVRRYEELERRYEVPERRDEELEHVAIGAFYVTARYGGVVAPPVVLPPSLLAGLASATGVLRDHLRRVGARAQAVDLPPHALADVDTPGDRDRLLRD